jgi:hypothetical protein
MLSLHGCTFWFGLEVMDSLLVLQLRVTGSMCLLPHMPLWHERTTFRSRKTVGTMIWVGGRSVQNLVANCVASTSCLKNVFSGVPVVFVWYMCVYTCLHVVWHNKWPTTKFFLISYLWMFAFSTGVIPKRFVVLQVVIQI